MQRPHASAGEIEGGHQEKPPDSERGQALEVGLSSQALIIVVTDLPYKCSSFRLSFLASSELGLEQGAARGEVR